MSEKNINLSDKNLKKVAGGVEQVNHIKNDHNKKYNPFGLSSSDNKDDPKVVQTYGGQEFIPKRPSLQGSQLDYGNEDVEVPPTSINPSSFNNLPWGNHTNHNSQS